MVLTDRQIQDLHIAILEYLRDRGKAFSQAATAFEQDAGLAGEKVPTASGLLEKKWTSIVRLQKKVMELEERLAAAEQELKAGGGGRGGGGLANGIVKGGGGDGSRNLPRAPPRNVLVGHRAGVTCLVTHPVFALLVSGSEDATIKTWDLESGEYEKTLKGHTNAIQSLAFNKSGSLLASCSSDLSIKIWDFASLSSSAYECLRTLKGHDHNISGLVFMPSGDQLVSCSRDHTLKSWEVSTGYCLKTFTGHSDWVRCVAVHGEGSLIASGGSDQCIMVWNVSSSSTSPALVLKEHSHVIESVAFPPAGVEVKLEHGSGGGEKHDYLVSGSRDKTVKLWNANTGQCLLTFAAHDNWVRAVFFHPSGQYILSCSDDRSIRIYDAAKGRCIRTLAEAHNQFVTCLVQHPTLPFVASGSVDREVHIWACS